MRQFLLRFATGCFFCSFLILFQTSNALAQQNGPEIDADAANNSPLLLLLPQAKDMSAPEWVKPGTRITFYGMAGSTPEGGYTLEKDPNGQWEDPTTGERYSKNEPVGAGGEGFAQVDVIAVGKHGVALSTNLYTIIKPGNPPSLLHTPLGGMLAAGAGPADLWVHPAILQQAQQFHTPNFFILRGNYPVFNKNYSCLCIVNRNAQSYSSQAYDLKTGVLVSGTTTSAARISNIHLPNEDPQRGNKGITITKFVSIRQLATPGINGTNPQWVANLRAMHFSGSSEFVNPYDASIRMSFPSRLDVSFEKRGDNWCAFTLQSLSQIQGAPPQQAMLKGVCGPAGAFWIDPNALADLQPGQVLDDDPVTHIRTAVSERNAQRIAITIQGPGVGGQVFYDLQSGQLIGWISRQPSSGITTTLQLSGTE